MDTHETQAARHANKIPIGDLAKIIEALATLQPDGSQPISAAAAIKGALKKPIKSALKRGVSYAQLAAMLRDLGVELTAETIKGYIREGDKPLKADQAAGATDTTEAPQTLEPAAIQAASAKPPIDVTTPNASGPGVVATQITPLPHPAAPQAGGA